MQFLRRNLSWLQQTDSFAHGRDDSLMVLMVLVVDGGDDDDRGGGAGCGGGRYDDNGGVRLYLFFILNSSLEHKRPKRYVCKT